MNADQSSAAGSAILLDHARALAQSGKDADAAHACEHAIAVWPDIRDAYRLRLQLARLACDRTRIVDALETLVRHDAEDMESCASLGAMLLEDGAFDRAAAVLRPVAARLGNRGEAMPRFAAALAGAGAWGELRALRPALDRLATDAPAPYAPYGTLAMAELAGAVDRDGLLAEAAALERSPRWLGAHDAVSRIAAAIADRQPFSLLRLDTSLANFASQCGRNAGRLLRPQERQALLDTAWTTWFGTASAQADPIMSALRQDFTGAIEHADIVAMPSAAEMERDLARFGALAEMHRLARFGTDADFAETEIAEQMHRQVPYLRTALAGLPFLGFVDAHPVMGRKLAHFCGVPDLLHVKVPREAGHPVPEDGVDPAHFMPGGHKAVLDVLVVPFQGAVFLVSAPGPLGVVYAGRIKALGGIALDIGPLASRWAGG